jgi:metal-responsive CopG/Arc/MetJ family transcriptional regulator
MTSKVMLSFPDDFLAEVDRLAREEHRSRSELVREALRHYIEMRQRQRSPGQIPHVQHAVQIQNELAQLSPGAGEDSTNDVRRWREAR